jgi:hypothetical protein
MTNTTLYTRISVLPKSVQDQVSDYVEFLIQKRKSAKVKVHPKAGCMKGIFKISDGFNDPLEDFKEYIQ